jgi:hypothetical protein
MMAMMAAPWFVTREVQMPTCCDIAGRSGVSFGACDDELAKFSYLSFKTSVYIYITPFSYHSQRGADSCCIRWEATSNYFQPL